MKFVIIKNGPIATRQNASISIECQVSNLAIGFVLGHDLYFNVPGQIWNLLYLSHKWSDCQKHKVKVLIKL